MKKRVFVFFLCLCYLSIPHIALFSQSEPQTGTITNENPFIEYSIRVPERGGVELTMQVITPELDAYLLLVDAQGNVVVESDQRNKTDLNPYIQLSNLSGGEYRVIATRYNIQEGDTTGDYSLEIIVTERTIETLDYSAEITPEALTAIGYQDMPTQPVAEWTILAYYGGDTNLEQAIINDIEEFELGGGSNEQVQIVAFLDRSPEYFADPDSAVDWSGSRIFHLQNATNPTLDNRVDTPALFELQPIQEDSGNGRTLAQFLTWGIRNFPAKNYIVAFASHGDAWNGVIMDETNAIPGEKTLIGLPQLDAAFAVAQQELLKYGIERFDLVINDACLMNNIEYYDVLSRYVDYALGSPEIVLSPALDMRILTRELRANPQLNIGDPQGIAKDLIEQYINVDVANVNSSQTVYMASALIDLQQIPALITNINSFAEYVNREPQVFTTVLGQTRTNTYTYSFYLRQRKNIDLGNFMQQLIVNSDDARLNNLAQDILNGIRASVVVGDAQTYVKRFTTYMNIFFPSTRAEFDNRYYNNSPLTEWTRLLNNYFNQLTAQVWTSGDVLDFHAPIPPKIAVVNTYPATNTPTDYTIGMTMNVQIEGRKLQRGLMTIDRIQPVTEDGETREQTVRLISEPVLLPEPTINGLVFVNRWESGLSQRNVRWDGFLTHVDDLTENSSIELLETSPDFNTALLRARYRPTTNDDWSDVSILFGESYFYTPLGGFCRDANSAVNITDNGIASVVIPLDSEVQSYLSLVNREGAVSYVPNQTYVWGEDGLRACRLPSDNGNYTMAFLLENFSGQTSNVRLNFSVQNPEDDSLNGNLFLEDGFNLFLPIYWSPLEKTEQGYYFSFNAESVTDEGDDIYSVIFPFVSENEPDSTDVCTLFDQVQARLNLFITEGYDYDFCTRLEADDRVEVVISQLDDDDLYGILMPTADPMKYLFVYTTLTPDEDDYSYFRDLSILDLAEYATRSTSEWDIETVSYDFENGTMPMPKGWLEQAQDTPNGFEVTTEWNNHQVFTSLTIGGGFNTSDEALTNLSSTLSNRYQNVELGAIRTYYGETLTWQVQFLTFTRDNIAYQGRYYVSTTSLGTTYSVLFGSEASANVQRDFTNLFELMLDGFNVPSPLRTFTDLTLNLELNYPRAWSYMFFDEESGYFQSSSLDFKQNATVYYEVGYNTPAEYYESFIASFGYVPLGEPTPRQLLGREGIIVQYLDVEQGFERSGIGFVSVLPESNLASLVVFETNSIVATPQEMQANFEKYIISELTFLEAQSEVPTSATLGTLTPLYEIYNLFNYQLQVPSAWQNTGGIFTPSAFSRAWLSPTGKTRLEVRNTYLLDVDTPNQLSAWLPETLSVQETTVNGRYALSYSYAPSEPFTVGLGLMTYLPESQMVLTIEVQGTNEDTVASQVLQNLNLQFDTPSVTFDPQNITDGLIVDSFDNFILDGDIGLTPPEGWTDWDESGASSAPEEDSEYSQLMFMQAFYFNHLPNAQLSSFVSTVATGQQLLTLGNPEPITLDGLDALKTPVVVELPGDVPVAGYSYFVFFDEDKALWLNIWGVLNASYKIDELATCIESTIRFDGEPSDPCPWTPTQAMSVDGVSFEAPLDTAPLEYDVSEDLWVAENEELGIEVYVYYGALQEDLDAALQATLDEYEIELLSEPREVTNADGVTALLFEIGDEESYYGYAVGFNSLGYFYIISIESFPDDIDSSTLEGYITQLFDSLRAP
jgi:hypothetical protein